LLFFEEQKEEQILLRTRIAGHQSLRRALSRRGARARRRIANN
jgi:hypothetical protein